MSVHKFKPRHPRTLEEIDAKRTERARQLIEEMKKTVEHTRRLIAKSRIILKHQEPK